MRKLILAAALAAAAVAAPVAHADENVGTTTGGPLIAAPVPVKLKALKIAEGTTRAQAVRVGCAFDHCDIRISPRAGTASIYDYNPFAYYRAEIDRGQVARFVVKMTAFKDDLREPTETFSLLAEQYVSNDSGTTSEQQNSVTMRILDRTPLLFQEVANAKDTSAVSTATASQQTTTPSGTYTESPSTGMYCRACAYQASP